METKSFSLVMAGLVVPSPSTDELRSLCTFLLRATRDNYFASREAVPKSRVCLLQVGALVRYSENGAQQGPTTSDSFVKTRVQYQDLHGIYAKEAQQNLIKLLCGPSFQTRSTRDVVRGAYNKSKPLKTNEQGKACILYPRKISKRAVRPDSRGKKEYTTRHITQASLSRARLV
ncbi:hypothetical protein K458DRAFT_382076 [Lentithecium fluviatile CBS 122367]|uniref:Uncharacterized protein n=1 Tax=Lentithecium fluviatile CBS 122367 TaxID=1168545 RepID=A0A6G1JNV3_9PLEO|nr:hypothetical protein K458DRAFT_382076 [Lentithecium fluviatile CBS 122367]